MTEPEEKLIARQASDGLAAIALILVFAMVSVFISIAGTADAGTKAHSTHPILFAASRNGSQPPPMETSKRD